MRKAGKLYFWLLDRRRLFLLHLPLNDRLDKPFKVLDGGAWMVPKEPSKSIVKSLLLGLSLMNRAEVPNETERDLGVVCPALG